MPVPTTPARTARKRVRRPPDAALRPSGPGLDGGDAVFGQRHRGGQDDEIGDQVGKPHADEGIKLDPPELGRRVLRLLATRLGAAVGADFFDFLRRRPEEKNGSVWHRDDTPLASAAANNPVAIQIRFYCFVHSYTKMLPAAAVIAICQWCIAATLFQ
jgi:hypothetical protein